MIDKEEQERLKVIRKIKLQHQLHLPISLVIPALILFGIFAWSGWAITGNPFYNWSWIGFLKLSPIIVGLYFIFFLYTAGITQPLN